jgi:hypothetical protein
MTDKNENTRILTRLSISRALMAPEKGANGLRRKGIPALKIEGKSSIKRSGCHYLQTPEKTLGKKKPTGNYVLIVPRSYLKYYEREAELKGYTIEEVTITMKNLTDVEAQVLDNSPQELARVLEVAGLLYRRYNARLARYEVTRGGITDVVSIEAPKGSESEPEEEAVAPKKGGKK